MKNLKGARAYLVGPMDRVKDNGVGWRRSLAPWLREQGIVVLDPTDKPILNLDTPGVAREENSYKKKLRDANEWAALGEFMSKIRNVDLRLIDISDFIIAKLDMDAKMCGTWEEIITANREKKPVLIVIEGGIAAAPDWLIGMLKTHLDYFHGSIKDLKIKIAGYNDGSIPMDKRWTLLDRAQLEV